MNYKPLRYIFNQQKTKKYIKDNKIEKNETIEIVEEIANGLNVDEKVINKRIEPEYFSPPTPKIKNNRKKNFIETKPIIKKSLAMLKNEYLHSNDKNKYLQKNKKNIKSLENVDFRSFINFLKNTTD